MKSSVDKFECEMAQKLKPQGEWRWRSNYFKNYFNKMEYGDVNYDKAKADGRQILNRRAQKKTLHDNEKK